MKKATSKLSLIKFSLLLQSITFYYYLLLLSILRTSPLSFWSSEFEENSMSALRPLPALRPSPKAFFHQILCCPHPLEGLITNKEENYGYSKFVHEE